LNYKNNLDYRNLNKNNNKPNYILIAIIKYNRLEKYNLVLTASHGTC